MKKELRRVVAVLLSVVMLISNVPVTALADWWTGLVRRRAFCDWRAAVRSG